ncbi:hypothetical protein Syun_006396 [Stephania yunnanensis]|uniref:Uncharacterized protein n=1 Tax=Stephania yunnanensis TaxID=152371 RepID=A0AAP0KXI4_9MAGN
MESGKKLLTPQPRLRTGFFSVLELSVGVAKHGKPIGLDEKIKVDLIVIGSVVVDPKTGVRLGKGEEDMQHIISKLQNSETQVTTILEHSMDEKKLSPQSVSDSEETVNGVILKKIEFE